jgi:pyruvate/2-oxoglutarate dehydrogenase complex dihydrolipoamide acyltransferase (E2) component
MSIEIRVPTLGESVTEATVGKWFKKAGDIVKADEPLVELETDKVTVEVPAPASGVMGEILVSQGTTVAVGSILAALKEPPPHYWFLRRHPHRRRNWPCLLSPQPPQSQHRSPPN